MSFFFSLSLLPLNFISRSLPVRRKYLEEYLGRLLELVEDPLALEPYLKQISRIFLYLKIQNPKITEMYWNAVLHCLASRRNQNIGDFSLQLQDAVVWYSMVNFRGKCRSLSFEAQLLNWISDLIDWSRPVINLRVFCCFASFVIAFGGSTLHHDLVEKIIQLKEQLNTEDVFNITHSLRLRKLLEDKGQSRQKPLMQTLSDLNVMLDRRTCSIAELPSNTNLNDTAFLMKTLLLLASTHHASSRIRCLSIIAFI